MDDATEEAMQNGRGKWGDGEEEGRADGDRWSLFEKLMACIE